MLMELIKVSCRECKSAESEMVISSQSRKNFEGKDDAFGTRKVPVPIVLVGEDREEAFS
jgi:hypothetical protein